MDRSSFRHVSICVSDLEQARRFYGGTLGFAEDERPDLGVPGIWYNLGGGLQLHVLVNEAVLPPAEVREQFNLSYPHFALACDDVPAKAAELRGKGLEANENVPPGGGFAQVFVKDPDGNMIEFIGPAPAAG